MSREGAIERVVLVAGTRPELVKLQPLAVALADARIPTLLVTTGQHRDPAMRDAFLDELVWPCPTIDLAIIATSPVQLIGAIAERLPPILRRTDVVVVEGDTTSVLAASVVSRQLQLRLAHVEAGLRSFDDRMPEEHNRRVADHLANDLFAPTAHDAAHLAREACRGMVHVVGNTVLDAVRANISRAPAPGALGAGHALVTLHRHENVDDPVFLGEAVEMLAMLDGPVLFPIHPRTHDRLRAHDLLGRILDAPHLRVTPPLGYLRFLAAMRDARVILTDSGGVQEEATAPEIRTPVVVLRRSTERVPAIDAGYSILANVSSAAARARDLGWFRPAARSPFGDGHAAERIAAVIAEHAVARTERV